MLIVLELCKNGALQNYLKKHQDATNDEMVKFATDACRGMCYLAGRKVYNFIRILNYYNLCFLISL